MIIRRKIIGRGSLLHEHEAIVSCRHMKNSGRFNGMRIHDLCDAGAIDHFHKWRPPELYSFVFMLIRPTALILKQIFF